MLTGRSVMEPGLSRSAGSMMRFRRGEDRPGPEPGPEPGPGTSSSVGPASLRSCSYSSRAATGACAVYAALDVVEALLLRRDSGFEGVCV